MSSWSEQLRNLARPSPWVGLLLLAVCLTGCSSGTECDGFLGTWRDQTGTEPFETDITITITTDDDNYLVHNRRESRSGFSDDTFAASCTDGRLTGLPIGGDIVLIRDGEAIAWAGDEVARQSD